MKLLRIFFSVALLAGCATRNSAPVDACLSQASGWGWNYMSLPPTNSVELRKLTGIAPATPVIWFEKSADQVLACIHAQDPGCNAMVYEYRRDNGLWQATWDHDAKACGRR